MNSYLFSAHLVYLPVKKDHTLGNFNKMDKVVCCPIKCITFKDLWVQAPNIPVFFFFSFFFFFLTVTFCSKVLTSGSERTNILSANCWTEGTEWMLTFYGILFAMQYLTVWRHTHIHVSIVCLQVILSRVVRQLMELEYTLDRSLVHPKLTKRENITLTSKAV